MTLATATSTGRPSARMVLLKEFDSAGFVFYSNYDSRKGGELAANPWAALVFFWVALARQVRVEGHVERATGAESDVYFASRPPGSQLGAWASRQRGSSLGGALWRHGWRPSRRNTGSGRCRARPSGEASGWCRTRSNSGRVANRLHDCLRYRRGATGTWTIQRLAP